MENAGLATSAGLRSLWSEWNSQGSRCMLLRSGEYFMHRYVGLVVQPSLRIVERTRPVTVLTVYTGDPSHKARLGAGRISFRA